MTHAHYQKMIEGIAGPNWTSNLGPLERAGAVCAYAVWAAVLCVVCMGCCMHICVGCCAVCGVNGLLCCMHICMGCCAVCGVNGLLRLLCFCTQLLRLQSRNLMHSVTLNSPLCFCTQLLRLQSSNLLHSVTLNSPLCFCAQLLRLQSGGPLSWEMLLMKGRMEPIWEVGGD